MIYDTGKLPWRTLALGKKCLRHDGHGMYCRFQLLLIQDGRKYADVDVNAIYAPSFAMYWKSGLNDFNGQLGTSQSPITNLRLLEHSEILTGEFGQNCP